MDIPLDMKKQLMEMAGIKDMKEFDAMAQKVAGSATKSMKNSASKGEKSRQSHFWRQSPFQGK